MKELRFLMMNKDKEDIAMICDALEKGMSEFKVALDSVSSFSDGIHQLEHFRYDVCLLDYRMGNIEVIIDFIRDVNTKMIQTPVIYLSEHQDSQAAARVLEAGASDYSLKNRSSLEWLCKSIGYHLKLREIDELRKKVQHELDKAHQQNQQLLSSISSILIRISEDGSVNYWNGVAEKSLGIPAADVLSRPLLECRLHWEAPRIAEAIQRCKNFDKSVRVDDVIFNRPDGKRGYLGFTVIPLGEDGFLLFGADITARKEAEEALRVRTYELGEAKKRIEQEKIQYAALLGGIGDGMIAFDPEGKIVMMNKQAEELLGWTAKEVFGKKISDLIPMQDEKGQPLKAEKRPLTQTLKQRKKISGRAYYVAKDKKALPVAITVSPIIFDGDLAGAIEIFRDITQEMEVDRMKSEFISTVSHELRTPLTGIREGITQVHEGFFGPINEEQKDFLNISLSELDRLTTIINDLLDIAKIEAGKLALRKSWVEGKQLVGDLILRYQSMMKNKGITVRTLLPQEEIRVFMDREKVFQVLTNLVSNAYKFTPEGGEIVMQIQKDDESVQFSVRDSGVGIEPENLGKIFDRFVQVGQEGAKARGTGLGLPISKNLVEMHCGRIWVESEYGKGSVFHFSIPIYSLEIDRDKFTDDLTGLHTREGFLYLAEQQVKWAKRDHKGIILIGLVMEHYPELVKERGRYEADDFLQKLIPILKVSCRKSDIVARVDQDKFVILAFDAAKETGEIVLTRIQEQINLLNSENKGPYPFAIHEGILHYPIESEESFEKVLTEVEQCLAERRLFPVKKT